MEIINVIPFTVAPKGIKGLGINLTKEMKGLYLENYNTFLKEIKEAFFFNQQAFIDILPYPLTSRDAIRVT